MWGEFDSNGMGWYMVNDFLYAINQETLKWKRYQLPATRFHGNAIQIDSKDRIWLALGRAKYLFDPKTEKFRYLMGFDWSHRDTDIICGWMQAVKCGCQLGDMDFMCGMKAKTNLISLKPLQSRSQILNLIKMNKDGHLYGVVVELMV
jgi:hypothetical protein